MSLLRVDVGGAIPAGADILSAELVLWTDDNRLEQGTILVQPVLEAWDEGTRNASSGASNFDLRLDGAAWTAPGVGPGSRADDDSVAEFVPDEAHTRYAVALPPALIESWRDEPQDNFGVALVTTADDLGCHFHTRESADEDRRPRLVVTYQP